MSEESSLRAGSPESADFVRRQSDHAIRYNVVKGPNGLRAGWRLLIYAALVFALGYAASKIADAVLHGRQPDQASPAVGIATFFVAFCVLLLAAWIMAKIEGRSVADYGLPWRRAFCNQFWQAFVIGFVSLTLLLTLLWLARAYSFGTLQLHGVDILKDALLWAVALFLGVTVEEFLYRGYLQFTLTSGVGFWAAALITSALMAAAHTFNPGWTVLSLCTVGGFGLIACLLLRRTGDLWMPIGLHAAWDWGETYFYGVPDSGLMGKGHLLQGSFHGPAWLTGVPFGVEAGWPNVALFLIWWFLFTKWLREVKYPQVAAKRFGGSINPRAIAFVAALIGGAIGAAQLCPAQETNPAEPLRVTTRLVPLDVIVLDQHGNPVSGLTKDDFVVLDNKSPRMIQLFSEESNQLLSGARQTLSPGAYSNEIQAAGVPSNVTIILLDSFNTGFLDQAYARSQIAKLLSTIRAEDRVALYTLGTHLRVLHEFTSDASSLAESLKKYLGERAVDMDTAKSQSIGVLHKDLEALAEAEGIDDSQPFAQDHRHPTAEALRMIADHVGSLPGRKNLVWVSGNFPFSIDTNNLQRTTDGQKIPFATDVELAMRALNNANVAVYPVDARGLVDGGLIGATASSNTEQDMANFGAMQTLARRTGGLAFYNTNAIKTSIRQAIDDSRVTYQLGFYPDGVNWDGSFHKLRVKVKRSNVRVESREGYFALAEPNVAAQTWREMISETARSPVEATGIRIRVQLSTLDVSGAKALSLSVSLDTAQFQFMQVNGLWSDTVEAAFIQLDDRNRIIQTSQLRLPLALDSSTYDQLLKQGMFLPRDLAILPNATTLQLIVRDGGSGKVGSLHIPLNK
jgi:VWFA-related protein